MANPGDIEVQISSLGHKLEADGSLNSDQVDFDGPDDPENAMNWPSSKKTVAITLISVMVMLS